MGVVVVAVVMAMGKRRMRNIFAFLSLECQSSSTWITSSSQHACRPTWDSIFDSPRISLLLSINSFAWAPYAVFAAHTSHHQSTP